MQKRLKRIVPAISAITLGVVRLTYGNTGTVTTLLSFNNANGEYPQAGLTIDSLGNLYGTAQDGGTSNSGTVFELSVTCLASKVLVRQCAYFVRFKEFDKEFA